MTDDDHRHRLTRRDALAVLVGGALAVSAWTAQNTIEAADGTLTDAEVDTLVAAADVLYPSMVDPSPEYVETYVIGRYALSDARIDGLRSALDAVEETSVRETGRQFAELAPGRRESVLRATGAHRSYPDPDGNTAQRIRYYVINDLLYAFYTTPQAGELVGNPNPTGHPGGIEEYRTGPSDG